MRTFKILSHISFIVFVSFFVISCSAIKPRGFVKSHDGGVWRSVHLHGNYGLFRPKNQEVWHRVVDILSEKYDIKMLDRTSGYIRTDWKNMPVHNGEKQYQTRIIMKMQGRIWHTAKMKTEARWRADGDDPWITGYDTVILDEMYRDIQGRLGTSVR